MLSLPAAASSTQVYTTHVPPASRVEARVEATADWDVTVTFDAATCLVFCEYRRKEQGLHLFQAPVTELLIYSDGASKPLVFTVDPAGLRVPRLAADPLRVPDLTYIESKRFARAVPVVVSALPMVATASLPMRATAPDTVVATALPLRI